LFEIRNEVKDMTKIPKTPSGLGLKGKAFWKKQLSEVPLDEAHELERLRLACLTLDDIEEASKIIQKQGRYPKNRFGEMKENPALKTMRDSRVVFCRIIRELGLDLEDPPDSRPPRQY
jgi:phage terminase small subunit